MNFIVSTDALASDSLGGENPRLNAPAGKLQMAGSPSVLRQLLELSCDWYWVLDSKLHLVLVGGRHLDAGPSPLSVFMGKVPWEWNGIQESSPDFEQWRVALLERQTFVDVELKFRDHVGRIYYATVSGTPDFNDAGQFSGFYGITRDLTLRKRSEALGRLEHAVTRSISEAATSRKILQAVMRVICESEHWETAGYFGVVDDLGTTQLIAGWAGPGMSAVAAEYYQSTKDKIIPPGGMLSKVVTSGRPLWLADLQEGQTTWSQRVRLTGERATLFFPVLVETKAIGVFAFSSREIREPDDQLLTTLDVIGEQVGQFLKRRQAEQVLRDSEARFRALTELSSDYYWETDAAFRFTRIEGREVPLGEAFPGTGAIGRHIWEIGRYCEYDAGWEFSRKRFDSHVGFQDIEIEVEKPDGTRIYVSLSGEPMLKRNGDFLGYRGVGQDITERKQADARINHLATHDALTALPNRVLFSEFLARAIQLVERSNKGIAILFVDLDGFKLVNDTLGHDAGDALLREIAIRLKDCLRSSDVLARMGGDEFVVLVQQVDCKEDVLLVARKILDAIGQPIPLGARAWCVTASVGISIYGKDCTDERSLMRNADIAMYAVKQGGKNGLQLYSPD